MKKKYMTKRRVNAIVASALAVTLAIPSSAFFGNAQAAFAEDEESSVELLPEPIATYDFERGLKGAGYDASGNALVATADKSEEITMYEFDGDGNPIARYDNDGNEIKRTVSNQPYISADAERGNVFTLQGSITTQEAYLEAPDHFATEDVKDASGNVLIAKGTALDKDGNVIETTKSTTAHSGATIDNPFLAYAEELSEGPDSELELDPVTKAPSWQKGVTISYWVKNPSVKDEDGESTGVAKDSNVLFFEKETANQVRKDDAARLKIGAAYSEDNEDYQFEVNGKVTVSGVVTSTPHYYTAEEYAAWNMDYEAAVSDGSLSLNYTYNKDDSGDGVGFETNFESVITTTLDNVDPEDINVAGAAESKRSPRNNKIAVVTTSSVDAQAFVGKVPTLKFYRALNEGDQFTTDSKGWTFTVTKADHVNGLVELTTEASTVEYNVLTEGKYGKYANYNPDFPVNACVLESQGDGYKLSSVSTYGQRNVGNVWSLPVTDVNSPAQVATKDKDIAALMFEYSGTWGFKESPLKLALYDQGGTNYMQDNYINGDNQAYAHAIKDFGTGEGFEDSLLNKPDEWTFVTYVIQNDHVSTYYDGELMDDKIYGYWGTISKVYAAGQFNKGAGYVSELLQYYQSNSTKSDEVCYPFKENITSLEPTSYTNGMTILELLTSAEKVHLGGQSTAASALTMANGTADGLMIDDLKFYIEPMSKAQVAALYDQEKAIEDKALEPVAKYTFDKGTEVTGIAANVTGEASSVAEPAIVSDASRSSVLALAGGATRETCSVALENPYKNNRDMTGATIAYWVKEEKSDRGLLLDSATVTFYDTPKPIIHDKLQDSNYGKEASSILYTTAIGTSYFIEGYSSSSISGDIKNNFNYVPDTAALSEGIVTEWNYMTMVVTNDKIQVYKNGELIENTEVNVEGIKFNEGYAAAMKDREAGISIDDGHLTDMRIFGGTNNMGATSLLSFLTDETTELYLGYCPDTTAGLYKTSSPLYLDDIEFYDQALTEDQIQDLYEAAMETFDGSDFKIGDANGDGEVDSDDAVIILQFFAGLEPEGINMAAADVNGDTEVDSDDAVEVLKFFAGLGSDYIPEE